MYRGFLLQYPPIDTNPHGMKSDRKDSFDNKSELDRV